MTLPTFLSKQRCNQHINLHTSRNTQQLNFINQIQVYQNYQCQLILNTIFKTSIMLKQIKTSIL